METSLEPVSQADLSHQLEVQKKRLKDSCKEFESVMVSYMMKGMYDGVRWDEEPDTARSIYEDMLAKQFAKEISRSSVLGIGDMLYSKLEPQLKAKVAQKSKETMAGVEGPNPPPTTYEPEASPREPQESVQGSQGSDVLNNQSGSSD